MNDHLGWRTVRLIAWWTVLTFYGLGFVVVVVALASGAGGSSA